MPMTTTTTDPLTEPFANLCSALRGMRDQVQQLVPVHDSLSAFNSAFGDFQNAMALHASCLQFPKAPLAKKVSIQFSGIPAPQVSGSVLVRRASRDSAESSSSLRASTPNGSAGAAAIKSRHSSLGGSGSKSKNAHTKTAATKKKQSLTGPSGFYNPQSSSSSSSSQSLAQHKSRGASKSGLQQAAKRRAAPATKRPASPAWKWDKHIRDQIPRKYQSADELKKLENILLYIKNRQSGITIADLVKHSGLAVIKSKEILQTLMKLELIHRDHEKSGFVYTFGSAH